MIGRLYADAAHPKALKAPNRTGEVTHGEQEPRVEALGGGVRGERIPKGGGAYAELGLVGPRE